MSDDALLLYFGNPITLAPDSGGHVTLTAAAPDHPDGYRTVWVLDSASGRLTDQYGSPLSA